MKKLILIFVLAYCPSLFAQNFQENQEMSRYLEKQGNLLTVRIIPGDKTIKVFLVGYETANAKFGAWGMEASAFIGQRQLKLNVKKEADHFNIERSSNAELKLDLKFRHAEKQDTIQFDIPKK